jgi:hypothetical protein
MSFIKQQFVVIHTIHQIAVLALLDRLGYKQICCQNFVSTQKKKIVSLHFRRWNIPRLIRFINHLNAELNPLCHLLAMAGAHHFVDASRMRVKNLSGFFFSVSCKIVYRWVMTNCCFTSDMETVSVNLIKERVTPEGPVLCLPCYNV